MHDGCMSQLPTPPPVEWLEFRHIGGDGGRVTSLKSPGIPESLPRPRFASKFDRIAVMIVDGPGPTDSDRRKSPAANVAAAIPDVTRTSPPFLGWGCTLAGECGTVPVFVRNPGPSESYHSASAAQAVPLGPNRSCSDGQISNQHIPESQIVWPAAVLFSGSQSSGVLFLPILCLFRPHIGLKSRRKAPAARLHWPHHPSQHCAAFHITLIRL